MTGQVQLLTSLTELDFALGYLNWKQGLQLALLVIEQYELKSVNPARNQEHKMKKQTQSVSGHHSSTQFPSTRMGDSQRKLKAGAECHFNVPVLSVGVLF